MAAAKVGGGQGVGDPPNPPPTPRHFFRKHGGGVVGQECHGNGKKNETSGMHGMSDSFICGGDGLRPRVQCGLHRGKSLARVSWSAHCVPTTSSV